MEARLEEANTAVKTDPQRAEQVYKSLLDAKAANDDELRYQETALVRLGRLYQDSSLGWSNAQGLAELVTASRAFMSSTAKAKTAKLIRTLIDNLSAIPNSGPVLTTVLSENIAWARTERRVFLRQNLEARLVGVYLDGEKYRPALTLIESLLTELRRLDDKLVLAEAALTSARTAANAIYCPPHLQAQLDLQSGILHAEDKDYKTGYSYFFETFENLSSRDDPKALTALKYMLLCKIMLNLPEDVTSLLSIKLALKFAQLRDVESMRAIALAHQNRNLAEFETALRDYKQELSLDPTIRSHLAALYDTLLEQNLLRIIEPYGCVELEHVAQGVGQSRATVEKKLSQMILDKVFYGVLDQGNGWLVVFDKPVVDGTYDAAIQTVEQVGKVVQSLYAKSVTIA
ncbi:26S proteasome regulatory subunit rpn6 [Ceratobasidium sp. 414]|nr:26S proteasome regulatory subunit rpn6 [Ceratobasidium sp. 414]